MKFRLKKEYAKIKIVFETIKVFLKIIFVAGFL